MTSPNSAVFNYEIGEKVSNNVLTETFAASKNGLNKKIMLVMLKPYFSQEEWLRDSFLHSVRFAAQFRHPHILSVFDTGEKDGRLFAATELMPLGSLSNWLENNDTSLTWTQTSRFIEDIADALDFIHTLRDEHGKSVTFGSFSPDNILLEYDSENAKILRAKLGIRDKPLYEFIKEGVESIPTPNPEYISPEEASDMPSTPYSDQYTLGIIAYQLLTGKTPFHGESAVTTYRRHKLTAPAPPSIMHIESLQPTPSMVNGNITSSMDEVILRVLSKNPSRRYESCTQFAKALRHAIESVQEKEYTSFLFKLKTAIENHDLEIGRAALDGAMRIRPNSDEVKSLSQSLKNLEYATELYKEARNAFFQAQEMARNIREEDADHPDEEGLLKNLAPLPPSLWQKLITRSRIKFLTFLTLISLTIVIGISTILYSETTGRESFLPTLVALDRTSTPTYAPPTPYMLTPGVTPQK